VRDYPLSKVAPGAKARLKDMGRPVPSADPDAIVRMQKQQLYEKAHHQSMVVKLPLGMLKGNPDTSSAARGGMPQMAPPNDAVSATDVLRPGAAGPSFTLTGSAAGASTQTSSTSSEVVTPEDATTAPVGSNTNRRQWDQPRRRAAIHQRHSGCRTERIRNRESTGGEHFVSSGRFKPLKLFQPGRDGRQRDSCSSQRLEFSPARRTIRGQSLHARKAHSGGHQRRVHEQEKEGNKEVDPLVSSP
jgi:hypothetical protein